MRESTGLYRAIGKSMLGRYAVYGERLTVKQLVEVVQSVSTKILKVRFCGRPYTNREVMILFNIGSKKCLNGLLRTPCVNLLAKSSIILIHEV